MPKIGIWIAIGIILLLGIGGVAYWKLAKPQPAQPTPQQTTPQQTSVMQSLKDLIMSGATVKCDVSFDSGKTSTSGTTFVSGKNIRADFSTTLSDGKSMTGHMIQDGTFAYIWSSAMPTGVKMKVEAITGTATASGQAPQTNAVDVNQKMNTTCSPWVADSAMFTPPTDVKFTDLSQMMQNLPKVPNIPSMPTPPTPPSGY